MCWAVAWATPSGRKRTFTSACRRVTSALGSCEASRGREHVVYSPAPDRGVGAAPRSPTDWRDRDGLPKGPTYKTAPTDVSRDDGGRPVMGLVVEQERWTDRFVR